MNEAMYHQEKWSRDVMIPSLYIHYYSVALNTRQNWIGNRRRDGMRWFAYNGQEDRICNQVLWERRCQEVSSSVWRWHERFCTILLLDEATSALDRENQDTFLTALRAWRINGARWWQWRIVWARLWTVMSSTWSTMVWWRFREHTRSCWRVVSIMGIWFVGKWIVCDRDLFEYQ